MNYQHDYHAGNFADVVKHVVLMALLTSLGKKESPYAYIDTHAGAGCYDLFSTFAKKSKEYENGIEKVLQANHPPRLINDYIQLVHNISNQLTLSKMASLRYYPGSPLIARQLIRTNDRITACELHPQTYEALRKTFAGDKQVAVHHTDGFQGLKAFLPPKEKRGVILIDPPYEDPAEFMHIAKVLPLALRRFETGVYAIWYPVKELSQMARFHRVLKETIPHPILGIELTIFPDIPNHLNGCGMIVINPPWQFDKAVQELLPWLWNALTINGQGQFRTFALK